jgi:phosphoribosyl 1,2-cyclic phosphodiesterase
MIAPSQQKGLGDVVAALPIAYTSNMLTCSLQSGSNGNCIYVEAAGVRLLFDAGISGRQARGRLAQHDRDIHDVDAVILSHRHGDHTRCAGVYQRSYNLPLYMTPATHLAIKPFVGKLTDVRTFQPRDTLTFGPVSVHTIATPHDAAESVAFVISAEGRHLGIFTDLGHPFRDLAGALADLHAVYLESNYDAVMLATGGYPEELKARIRGDGGHISNDEAVELLRRCLPRPKWVALSHLSEHNNDPNLALETHRATLGQAYPLWAASRYRASDLTEV